MVNGDTEGDNIGKLVLYLKIPFLEAHTWLGTIYVHFYALCYQRVDIYQLFTNIGCY
ncbi:hypothetical protein WN55_05341 [Dufourea novaeangliae]|uniref:Uncharacterized protein n=1 Tax=Dufourea novaeangliae TaxID=178035 RepID=A0A154PLI8_DUFNO|nr:hypothetical protein WN55_05341 [Dufourea novaeangliae]